MALEFEYFNSDGKLLKTLDTADRSYDLSKADKKVTKTPEGLILYNLGYSYDP